jgi:hypothetical protein
MKSQNAKFKAEFPSDAEFEHPPGIWLTRRLSADITEAGWHTSNFNNWRDCGWSIPCTRDNVKLEVVFAPLGDNEWMLQIAPLDCPGFLHRLFGARPSVLPSDVVSLAKVIHGILSRELRVSGLLWRVDGPPDEEHSTSEPMEENHQQGAAADG